MSDNKKYYYLKLKNDFFESDSMIILESMPDGYKYSNILLKLYLRSLKDEGKLMLNERIPYNATMLAQVTRHSVGDIERAVKLFEELGLIEMLSNGAMFMADIQNFIGKSSTEADRKREYRNRIENEKQLVIGQMSGQTSDGSPDKSPPEIELEKEIELERDIDKEKPSPAKLADSFEEIWKLYPRKEGKKNAFSAFKRSIKSGSKEEDIRNGVIAYANHVEANRIQKKFIKQGSTFFNGENWNDEYDITTRSGGYDTSEYDNFF